jgi:hypothetical protein
MGLRDIRDGRCVPDAPLVHGLTNALDRALDRAARVVCCSTRFCCPPPAGSCAFLGEVCCFGLVDAGRLGMCAKAGETCPSEDG